MKKKLSILIRLFVTLVLIGLLFLKVDFKNVLASLVSSELSYLLLAFIILLLGQLLGLKRWQILLFGLRLHPPLKKIFTAYCGGMFFNLLLPSTVGGDIARIYSLFSHTKEGSKVAATVIIDRLSGFMALTFIATVALFSGYGYIRNPLVITSVSIIAVFFFSLSALLFSKKIASYMFMLFKVFRLHRFEALLVKVFDAMALYKVQKGLLFKSFLLSVLIQCLLVLIFYFIGLALGIRVNPLYYFIIVPIIGAISTVPITIAGLGLRDASSVLFFSKIGIEASKAFSISLISFFLVVVIGLLAGIFYAVSLHSRRI